MFVIILDTAINSQLKTVLEYKRVINIVSSLIKGVSIVPNVISDKLSRAGGFSEVYVSCKDAPDGRSESG